MLPGIWSYGRGSKALRIGCNRKNEREASRFLVMAFSVHVPFL